MTSNNLFSVIIPTLNEEIRLPALLSSLANQTDKDFEVIVADSGSKDKTREKAFEFKDKLPKFCFLEGQFKRVAAARNGGARLAHAAWLIFLDADVIVPPDFVLKIRKIINEKNPDVMTAWNATQDKGTSGRLMLFLISLGIFLVHKIRSFANGPCIIIKKELFDKIKGFNEAIIVGEDLDLTDRATKFGGKYRFLLSPVVYVSSRRYEKEGFFLSFYKGLVGALHTIFIGPVKKPLYKYEMGGQYFDK